MAILQSNKTLYQSVAAQARAFVSACLCIFATHPPCKGGVSGRHYSGDPIHPCAERMNHCSMQRRRQERYDGHIAKQ